MMINKKKKLIMPILSLGILGGGTIITASACNKKTPDIEVTLNKVVAPISGATDHVEITLSMEVPDLNADNISIKAITGSAKISGLENKGGGLYWADLTSVMGGDVTISIASAPKGYNITGSRNVSLTQGITVNNISCEYNHDKSGYVQLSFSADMRNLTQDNIVLQTKDHIIQKGTLVSEGNGKYQLPIIGVEELVSSIITASIIAPDGYYINNQTPTTISFLQYVSLNTASAEYNNDGSGYIKLSFSGDISDLNENDINLISQGQSAQKGTLQSEGGGVYFLPIINTEKLVNTQISVTVVNTPTHYIDNISTDKIMFPQFVSVKQISPSYNPDGSGYISFTFSQPITGMNENYIDLQVEGHTVEKGTLTSKDEGTYLLPINNITEIGTSKINIRISSPQGYYIGRVPSDVIQFPTFATLNAVTPIYDDKGDGYIQLVFSQEISNLDETFINFQSDVAVEKGALRNEGGGKYLVPIINKLEFVSTTFTVNVSNPDGYFITNLVQDKISFSPYIQNTAMTYENDEIVVYFNNDSKDIFLTGALAKDYFTITADGGSADFIADAIIEKQGVQMGRWVFKIKINTSGYIKMQLKNGAISTGKYYITGLVSEIYI